MRKKLNAEQRSVKNRWILLTGASGGIGEAIAIELYSAGAKLILVGRDHKKLLALRTRNQFSASRAAIIEADLGNPQGREKTLAACAALPEPVSVLINNAGISDFNFLANQREQDIATLINTNLISPILLTKALLPILRKAEQPVVVNIGSTFGSIGYPGFCVYSASKFGFRGFTEALRRELANTSVQVCYVAPRATRTAINSSLVYEMNAALGTAMDEPVIVAKQVLKAIEQRKAETYIGWPEKLFVKINQLLPKIVDGALLKQLPIISRFSQRRAST